MEHTRNRMKKSEIARKMEKLMQKYSGKRLNDTSIYFGGKCWRYKNGEKTVIQDMKGSQFTEYANDKTITVTFEGVIYDHVNGDYGWDFIDELDELLQPYGYYKELGEAWNFALHSTSY